MLYSLFGLANEKNAASQPQPSAGSSYVNGPPPPAYSKEVEASAPPQGYMQYSMGQPHVFNQAMQPYSGSMQYGYPQPPNMYYANASHPMHMSAQQAMAQGMYLAQPQFQAGPPPGYGGGPQYPTGYCPPPPYQSPIHVQHQQSVYHPGTAVPVRPRIFFTFLEYYLFKLQILRLQHSMREPVSVEKEVDR